jgi:hypothetical protein
VFSRFSAQLWVLQVNKTTMSKSTTPPSQRIILQTALQHVCATILKTKSPLAVIQGTSLNETELEVIRHVAVITGSKLKPIDCYESLVQLFELFGEDTVLEACLIDSYVRLRDHLTGKKAEKTMYSDLVRRMTESVANGNLLSPADVKSEIKEVRRVKQLETVRAYQARKKSAGAPTPPPDPPQPQPLTRFQIKKVA